MSIQNVSFFTSDTNLQTMYDTAEKLLYGNLIPVDGGEILINGSGYNGMWIEDGPIYADLLAKRRLDVSLNMINTFIKYQRTDGRIPGMFKVFSANDADNQRQEIGKEPAGLAAYYGYLQGFCFPEHALNMYYYADLGSEYLENLYSMLERYDAYLWRTRDSDGDGCLELWCEWDTGEDNSIRLEGMLHGWGADTPPADTPAPFESMDVMSWSFAARNALAKISAILKNGNEVKWKKLAYDVSQKIRDYLWIDEKKACYDRDKENNIIDTLIHNNLRCMYYGSFSQDMAADFVKYHLKNPNEFWTNLPLPCIAVNDPAFRNVAGNNFGGQPNGITFVRSLFALERYGFYSENTHIGRRLIEAITPECQFAPQFDPFTMEPSGMQLPHCFSATILSFLEHVTRMFGVRICPDQLKWYAVSTPEKTEYRQIWKGHEYTQLIENGIVNAYIDRKNIFTVPAGFCVITNANGDMISAICIEEDARALEYRGHQVMLEPNQRYEFC